MGSGLNSEMVRRPGVYPFSSNALMAYLGLSVLGALGIAYGFSVDAKRTWFSLLHNHFYFFSLAIGGLFFAALQWLTGAMWSAPIRRLAESFSAFLPVALLSFVGIAVFGLKHLYTWLDPETVSASLVLQGKRAYLGSTFFIVRNLVFLAVILGFAKMLIGRSVAQDKSADSPAEAARFTLKNRTWTPAFMILFALGFTMASFDLIMSLDPLWFSTMFGVYCFAGLFYSVLAATCLMTLKLIRLGYLRGIVNDNHLHDLGKFMFAFTVFWAYIGFSQFMLIWYANQPEETHYFLHRFHGGWMAVSIFLLVGKFLTPFFLLLPRDAKRSAVRLKWVAIFMLVAQWIDVLWMTQPQLFSEGPRFGVIELAGVFLFLGLFAILVRRFLAKHSEVAIGDPRLAESVFHHHQ